MSLLWQVIENMTVGHFETAEQLAWQRAWRCTLTVPYVHKLPVQSRRSSLSLRTHSKNQATRDFGVFFMGACRYSLHSFKCAPFLQFDSGVPVPCCRQSSIALLRVWSAGKIGPEEGYATRRRMAAVLGNLTDSPMTLVSTSTPRAPGFERECDLHACLEGARCVGCSWDPKATERLYEHRLQWSEFSLIVRGDTPSSARLYDALAYGVSPPP